MSRSTGKLADFTVNAGPLDPRWQDRLREELIALVSLVEKNAESDDDWFSIEPLDDAGLKWTGTCWYIHERKRYTYQVQFEIPATYPTSPIEIELPELDGKTAKMYRGGKICLDLHFSPLWRTNAPRFGITHALCLALGPWLAAEIPYLVGSGKLMRHVIGLIADVQYADIEDVWNFMKTHKRKYRGTLTALRNAVDWWSEQKGLDLVVDLGDAIDGFRNETREAGMHALRCVMGEWNRLIEIKSEVPLLHLIGNHELYKFTREELTHGVENTGFCCGFPGNVPIQASPKTSLYYTFQLSSSSPWRAVVLDPYEMSLMTGGGGRIGHELTIANGGINAEYAQLCQSGNPNDILKGTNFFEGVSGPASRWTPFNGGIGETQILWLETVLSQAVFSNEKVIVFTHVILHPEATSSGNCQTLLWNYEVVLKMFARHPCVRMVFAGHAHQPQYAFCAETKIHHVTLASPLEAPEELVESTFGMLEISDDDKTAVLTGKGAVPSMELCLY